MTFHQQRFTRYCALLCALLPFGIHAQPIDPADILAGKYGYPINGAQAGDHVGEIVDGAGDVNGDGFDDVIVKSFAYTRDKENIYVVFGKSTTTPFDLSAVESGSGGFKIDPSGITPEDDGLRVGWVHGAGDVNGDGLDDVIVGIAGAGSDFRGSAYIVFGKPDTATVQLTDIAASIGGWPIVGSASHSYAGLEAIGLGDINGDGLDDVGVKEAVGFGPDGEKTFTVSVVFGKQDTAPVSLSSIAAGVGGFVVTGDIPVAPVLGLVFSGVGDVNSDGLDDMVVLGNHDLVTTRQQYVVFGKSTTTAVALEDVAQGIGGFAIISPASILEHCLYVGAGQGDINGDGRNDILLGAVVFANFSTTDRYELFAVFGKSNTTPVMLDSVKAGRGGFLVEFTPKIEASHTAAIVNDLNNDGRDDIVVGISVLDGSIPSQAGYMIYGRPAALPLDIANLESLQRGHRIPCLTPLDEIYRSVAAAGDVNADGRGDFIFGSTYANPGNRTDAGRAYLVFGGFPPYPDFDNDTISDLAETNTGVIRRVWDTGTDPTRQDSDGDGVDDDVELRSGTDPNNRMVSPSSQPLQHVVEIPDAIARHDGFVINGRRVGEQTGTTVARAGDINADGLDDVLVLAPARPSGDQVSDVYVVFGAPAHVGPVNLNDVAEERGGGFVIRGNALGSAEAAGDVNGDGYDDIRVDSYMLDNCVVFGKPDFRKINTASIESGQGHGYVINVPYTQYPLIYGTVSANLAGDINGDGLNDQVVGLYETSEYVTSTTNTAVVFGKADYTPISENDVVSGAAGFLIYDERIRGPAMLVPLVAGDINADGFADIITGGWDVTDPDNEFVSFNVVFGKSNTNPVYCSELEANAAGFKVVADVPASLSAFTTSPSRSATALGDINGDGHADFAFWQPDANQDEAEFGYGGSTMVVFGKSDSATVRLSDVAAGIGGFRIYGFNQGGGGAVGAAGDINADGLDDMVVYSRISLPPRDGGVPDTLGQNYIVFGKTDTAPVETLSVAYGTGGFALRSALPEEPDYFYFSATGAGDVNGDGFDDIIAGAPEGDSRTAPGRAYVVYGFQPSAPDSDQDLIPDYAETGGGTYVDGDNTGTDRNNADSDGDGILDGTEGTLGTDPNDPEDFPSLPILPAMVMIIALGILAAGLRAGRYGKY